MNQSLKPSQRTATVDQDHQAWLDQAGHTRRPRNFWQTLAKYFRLHRQFVITGWISDLEFRLNFALRLLTDIFWYAGQIVTFEVLFRHTPLVGDWNLEQVRVFLGVVFVVDALYMIFLSDNLDRLGEYVRRGSLDFLLVKPVNSQFMVSTQRVAASLVGNLTLSATWLGVSLWNLPELEPWRLLWLVLLVPIGLVVLYCLRFFLSSCALIFVRSESLSWLWYTIYRLGLRPDNLYPPWLKFVILSVLPVGVIASVPARFLLEPPHWLLLGWVLLLGTTLLWLSSRFWRFALRAYQSASS